MRTVQRDITDNPTRLIAVAGGYAGQVQDVIGWVTIAKGPFRDPASASRRMVELGFRPAPAPDACARKLGFGTLAAS